MKKGVWRIIADLKRDCHFWYRGRHQYRPPGIKIQDLSIVFDGSEAFGTDENMRHPIAWKSETARSCIAFGRFELVDLEAVAVHEQASGESV